DSARLSGQAISAARTAVENEYGKDYLFERARNYGGQKGSQDAHEAIRPAGSHFKKPKETGLRGGQFKLYDLIWKRTVATQMKQAKLEFTNVTIEVETYETQDLFRSNGKKTIFPCFFRAYVEGSDDPISALENRENPLPNLTQGEEVEEKEIASISHETKPPARYTEA